MINSYGMLLTIYCKDEEGGKLAGTGNRIKYPREGHGWLTGRMSKKLSTLSHFVAGRPPGAITIRGTKKCEGKYNVLKVQ